MTQKGYDRFADIFSVGCSVLEYASLVVLDCWNDSSEGGELLNSSHIEFHFPLMENSTYLEDLHQVRSHINRPLNSYKSTWT
jgi:hypothetical protein